MNAPTPEADPTRLLAAALELPPPAPAGGPDPFAGTSLGTSAAQLLAHLAPREHVDRILAGCPPPRRPAPPRRAEAWLVGTWQRELRRLRLRHEGTDDDVLTALGARGHMLTAGALRELLGAPAPSPNRALAADLVTVLGGAWTGGGYAALYEAARNESTDTALGERVLARSLHGLPGAEPVDATSLRARLRTPDPTVRVHGREPLVRRLIERLTGADAGPLVLVGESGVGKSTVAQVVAQRVDEETTVAVWWAPAHDETELIDALFAAAAGLGATMQELRAAMNAPDRIERLWGLLDRSPRRWLLILDDAGPDAVAGPGWVRPSTGGAVLVTSRIPDGWPHGVIVTRLAGLDPACGGRVVLDRIVAGGYPPRVSLTPQVQELSRRLGGIPLALHAVGTFLGSGMSPVGVDELLDPSGLPPADADGMRSAYELALQGITGSGVEGARDALRLLACFAPDEPVPASLLHARTLPSAWALAVDHLVQAGLVESIVAEGQQCLRVHPAVAEQARQDRRFTPRAARRLVLLAVGLLHGEANRLDPGVPAHWPALRRLEPHTEELLEVVAADAAEQLAAVVRLARSVATGLTRAGNHAGATALLQRCLVRSSALGDDHRERLGLRRDLAWLTGLRGDLRTATVELRALLATEIRLFGTTDAGSLATRDRLAWGLAEQGDLARAEIRLIRLLPAVARMLGEEHADTLSIRHRLAWVTALRGRHGEAVAQLEQVLALRVSVLGPDHMDVFSTRYRLAWALAHRDRLDAAERQFAALRADLEQIIGAEHPMMLMVRYRSAWVHAFQNRYDDAERGYSDLLADQEKVLGPEHPRTLRTRHMLAGLLLHRGKYGEAEERLRSLVHDGETLLGPDHHDTLDMRFDLALAVARGGQVAEAERLLRALVADRRRVLGRTAPRTLVTVLRLARVLVRRGQLDEADALLANMVAEAGAVLEPDGSLMFDVRHTRAFVTGMRGRLRDCEKQFRALLADRVAALGPDDRETLATRDYLCWVVGVTGRTREAEQACRDVLADRRRVFGPDHPTTLFSGYRLAWLRASGGHHDDAERMFTENLADVERTAGPDSRDALRNRGGLAWVLRLTGRLDEAEDACRALVADRLRIHGPDDVHTLRARDALGLVLVEQGRLHAAERLFEDLLTDLDDMLGPHHRDTFACREHIARVLAQQGRHVEAIAHYLELDRERRLAFDPEHPDLRRAPRPEFLRRVSE